MAYWMPLLIVFLTLDSAFSADPPESSPSPAPEYAGADDSDYPISYPPSPHTSYPPVNSDAYASPESQSPSPPHISYPPDAYGSAFPETPLSRSPSPSPSTVLSPPADADMEEGDFISPAPVDEDSIENVTVEEDNSSSSSSSSSGGKNAGIAFGIVIGGGVVVLAGIVYKKRRDNIHRSKYGYASRRGLL